MSVPWTAALPLLFCGLMLAGESAPIIIDTDCGHDDLTAIAFLLARRDVRIEAVTIANGLAHVPAGAANVLRLLELGGRGDVPVYMGRETPMRGHAAFPDPWRKKSDALLSCLKVRGLKVPAARRPPETLPAAEYLAARLHDRRRPVRILALGPLTNLAEALEHAPGILRGIDIVMMGGAIRVPGNLGDGGDFKTDNKTAEWNLFVDPLAAKLVFASAARITLVPLDATNQVPIDAAFLRELRSSPPTPLGEFVVAILERDRKPIEEGSYYAWDAVAAVALVEPAVLPAHSLAIEVKQTPPEEGRTVEAAGQAPNATVALGADPDAFRKAFLRGMTR